MLAPTLFAAFVAIVIAGWLWFYVVRPILEDYGVMCASPMPHYDPETKQLVNRYQDDGDDYVAPGAGSEPVRAPVEPPEPVAVRAHQNQLEPSEPPQNEPACEPSARGITARLERAELITLLAVQKNADGSYTFSANKITEFVGGTAADVKAQIAAIRTPQKPEAQNERGKSLRRPAEGW
jgi:hypothetical protein